MIKIKIGYLNSFISFVEVKGHANYSNGDDIVCASVSSIVQTALLGLINVVGVQLNYERKDGFLSFKLPSNLNETEKNNCEIILKTMLEGIKDIQYGFSKYVKVEEDYNVY